MRTTFRWIELGEERLVVTVTVLACHGDPSTFKMLHNEMIVEAVIFWFFGDLFPESGYSLLLNLVLERQRATLFLRAGALRAVLVGWNLGDGGSGSLNRTRVVGERR